MRVAQQSTLQPANRSQSIAARAPGSTSTPPSSAPSAKPTGFFARAVDIWTRQVESARTQAMTGIERMANALAKNDHEGQVVRTRDAEMVVGKPIGSGFFGVVYRVEVRSVGVPLPPELVDASGQPRDDLVVKFPHRLPHHRLAIPQAQRFDLWLRAINEEARQYKAIQAHLGDQTIRGAEILYAHTGPEPFLIKPFFPGAGPKKLGQQALAAAGGRIEGVTLKLTDVQREALRTQIFEPVRIAHAAGVAIDIKPANLAWDESSQTWGMYELTLLDPRVENFFIKPELEDGGFARFVRQFQSVMTASVREHATR